MFPSGMRMPSGFVAILLFTQGLFYFKKCPDVPDSAAARLSTCLCVIVFVVSMMLIYSLSNLSHTRCHLSLLSSQPLFRIFPPIFLCCCFGLLKEFLDEFFGESWPCGEEVVFNCG